MKVKDIVSYLLKEYPTILASSFDMGKIGLQFGSMNKEVKKVLIALDGSTNVIKEAIDLNVDLLITHHPFMFNSLLNMNYDNPLQERIKLVIQNELNVFAMHTNFDVANNGMNEILAKKIGINNIRSDQEEIDNNAFLRYGEVDVTSLDNFIEHIKRSLSVSNVRFVGNLDSTVHKVGIIGGSGGFELYKASFRGCDTFITGEIKHNQALDAIDLGINLIEVSHGVESVFKEYIKNRLEEEFDGIEFILSNSDTDPFKIK